MQKIITLAACICLYAPSLLYAAVIFEDNFDGYSMPRGAIDDADAPWTGMGSDVVVTNTGCRSGKCIKATYTVQGTSPYIFSKLLDTPLVEGYYSFWFKLENNVGCGGSKFLKLRAYASETYYSNITTQMKYSNSVFNQIDFGCGTGDQGCGGAYNNSYDWNLGTVLVYTSNWTIPNNEWHHYELYVKWNTDGNTDGKYTVWLDGVKRRETINTKMRDSTSPAGTTEVLLSDYFYTDGCDVGTGYSLYYDDVVISTTYSGMASTPIAGVCGSANGGSFSEAPTANLCSIGTPSTVAGTGPWSWTCEGLNGGDSGTCSASLASSPSGGGMRISTGASMRVGVGSTPIQ